MIPSCDSPSSDLLSGSACTGTGGIATSPLPFSIMRIVGQYRWQIATGFAVCVAVMSWIPIPGWRGVERAALSSSVASVSERTATVALDEEDAAAADQDTTAVATPSVEVAVVAPAVPEEIPGLAQALGLVEGAARGGDEGDRLLLVPPIPASAVTGARVKTGSKEGVAVKRAQGTLKVRTQPEGAVVVCDGREIGTAPLEHALTTGRHEVSARWQGRDARVRTVMLSNLEEELVSFDFRTKPSSASASKSSTPVKKKKVTSKGKLKKKSKSSSSSSKSRGRSKKKPKKEESVLVKVGRSVKELFHF